MRLSYYLELRKRLIGGDLTRISFHSHWPTTRSSPFGDGKLLEGVEKNLDFFFCPLILFIFMFLGVRIISKVELRK
jgi:hypothetical protein